MSFQLLQHHNGRKTFIDTVKLNRPCLGLATIYQWVLAVISRKVRIFAIPSAARQGFSRNQNGGHWAGCQGIACHLFCRPAQGFHLARGPEYSNFLYEVHIRSSRKGKFACADRFSQAMARGWGTFAVPAPCSAHLWACPSQPLERFCPERHAICLKKISFAIEK